MPLDIHVRVAAWLHIAMGAITAGAIGLFALFFGAFGMAAGAAGVASMADHQAQAGGILAWIAGLGVVFFLFLMAFPVLEIVGGVMLLSGKPAGRVITIVFSILGLLGFPVGTGIGIYSLWALLRTPPQSPLLVVVAPAGDLRPY